MRSTMSAARTRGHLSRHERQRVARAEAFSRHTPGAGPVAAVVNLSPRELELIDRLVRRDRTAVSSAFLLIGGIGAGAGGERRRAVLVQVSEAAAWARANGAITARRGEQIARHVSRALGPAGVRLAA